MDIDLEESNTVGFTILSQKQPRQQKWNFKSGPAFQRAFPFFSYVPRQLKYSNQFSLYSKLPIFHLDKLRKKRISPRLNCGWCHAIHSLAITQTNADRSVKCITAQTQQILNMIFKEAKSLNCLTLELECGLSNFHALRRIRDLQELSLKIEASLILKYPQLFQRFTSLQKAKLFIRGFSCDNEVAASKFFGHLLNQQMLYHLTIWLEGNSDYFKTLLSAIHRKKIPSFDVIASSFEPLLDFPQSLIKWANFIDTLYLGPIGLLAGHQLWNNYWSAAQKPERRVMLNYRNMKDLTNGSLTIKDLTVRSLFYLQIENSENLLKFISQTKTLQTLSLISEAYGKDSDEVNTFYEKFSQIESLENLMKFTFELRNDWQNIPKISAPYSRKMKNLKALYVILEGQYFELSDFAETLEELVSLEIFHFRYLQSNQKKIECNFSFKELKNLKTVSLYSIDPFQEKSINKLIESISKEVENLESVQIFGEVLDGAGKDKADELIEGLHSKKNLKSGSITWKEGVSLEVACVRIQRGDDGKLIIAAEFRKEG